MLSCKEHIKSEKSATPFNKERQTDAIRTAVHLGILVAPSYSEYPKKHNSDIHNFQITSYL